MSTWLLFRERRRDNIGLLNEFFWATPAVMDLKGLAIFIGYSQIFVIANIGIKKNFWGTWEIIAFIGGLPLLADPI